jgi:RHS repeat-associated protein
VIGTQLDVAAAATGGTVQMMGDGNALLDNASPAVTLWLQGNDWYQQAVLTTAPGATNAGTLLLSPTSATWGDELIAPTPLLNVPGGLIKVTPGGGAPQAIEGGLINQGTLWSVSGAQVPIEATAAGAGPSLAQQGGLIKGDGALVLTGGRFDFTGGTVQSGFLVDGATIDVAASVSAASTVPVAGPGNWLVENAAPAVTLWVKGTAAYQTGSLLTAPGASNQGTIRLASEGTAAWGQDITAPTAFTNYGTIEVDVGAGADSYFYGNVVNVGTLTVQVGATLWINGVKDAEPTLTQRGAVHANGKVTLNRGVLDFESGSIDGDQASGGGFFVNGANITVSPAVTTPSTVYVYKPNGASRGSEVVKNGSPAVTLVPVDDPNAVERVHPAEGPVQLTAGALDIENGGTVNFQIVWNYPLDDFNLPGSYQNITILFGDGSGYHFDTYVPSGTVEVSHRYPTLDLAPGTTREFVAQVAVPIELPNWIDIWMSASVQARQPTPAQGGPARCPYPQTTTCPTGSVKTNQSPSAKSFSQAPVRYFDGTLEYQATDLSSDGFGTPWAQSRSWTNDPAYTANNTNGFGWVDAQMPHLAPIAGGGLAVVESGITAQTFDLVDGSFQERGGGHDALYFDTASGDYFLGDQAGNRFVFAGFGADVPAAGQGGLLSETDAAGNVTTVNRNADGTPAEVLRSDSTASVTESFLYAYVPAGDANAGRLASVTLRRRAGAGDWAVVQSVAYAYYDGVEANGNLGDLKTAVIYDAAGEELQTYYYRYYVAGEAGGYQHGLKYVLEPTSFARLAAAVADPFSAADAQIAPYADYFFQYDGQDRVSAEVAQGAGCSACSAGLGTFTFSYTPSANPVGFNEWAMRTVETLPDGNQHIVYTNAYGEVMLLALKDVSSGQQWVNFYEYNAQGQVVLAADPSAVAGYDDSYGDLLHWTGSGYQYLRDHAGLITLFGYAAATTATQVAPGDVAGYLQYTAVEQGQLGAIQLQEVLRYYYRWQGGAAGSSVAVPATDTLFSDPSDPQSGRTTLYAYTWYAGTLQEQSEAVTVPTVTADQNGPDAAATTTTFFDLYGRPTWTQDAAGTLSYTAYDVATGAVIKTITDVDTTRTADFTNLPSGWATPAGGGLHLVTTTEVDALGRPTEVVDPDGNTDFYVYDDAAHEVRSYLGWDSATGLPTGPTQVVRADWGQGYVETLTMSAAPDESGGRPTGTEAISDVQTLSRTYTNLAQQVVASDDYFNLAGLAYSTAAALGAAGVNYYEKDYGYDHRGRLDREVSPTGTITRTVYDALNRVVSEWVGTNDTPVSGYWSPSNPAGMVMVRSYVYDNGGVGDNDLTAVIDYPGGGAATRATDNYYDWRDRLVASKAGVQASEADGTHRLITYYSYDNLGEVVVTAVYDGDGVSVSDANGNGVPDAPPAGLLRAYATAAYDALGRVYQTQIFAVDPATGAVSANALTTDSWYDLRGELIKTAAPGGLVSKTQYDGAGRPVVSYTSDGGGDSSWADALNVNGDTVLEQVETQYDADSNAIAVTTRQRFDDATGTGPLGTPTAGVPARVYYAAAYYDALGRVTATVDVGTNGGAAWTRQAAVPARSDTVLVTSTTYNAAGWAQDVTDPRGIVTRTQYDNLGQVVKTIEAYTDGVPTASTNKTTEYTYDGDGHVLIVQADEPGGAYQQTQYVYCVTRAAGSAVDSNDILAAVRYPDPTTGAASAAQQETRTVNALGETTTYTDRNGSVHAYTYDAMGRVIADAITTLGAGVDGSVRRIETAYDSQGNASLLTSYDAAVGGNIVNQVLRTYNGLGQLAADYQSHSGAVDTATTPSVRYAYTEMAGGANNSRLVSMTYPNGRVLTYNYNSGLNDSISRLSSISDSSGVLEAYSYLGLATVVRRAHPQTDIDLTYIAQTGEPTGDAGDKYTGLDRFGRVVDQRWLDTATGSATDEFQYGYDADGNVLYKANLVNPGLSELYHANGAFGGYDDLNQLTGFARGQLSDSNGDGVTDTVTTPSSSQSWTLDALGNWPSVITDGTTQTRSTNQQNQLTSVGGVALTYDADGNQTGDQNGNTLVYDAWGRLVQVKDGSGNVIAGYGYDALGRRVVEAVNGTTTDVYFSAQWQALEDRVGGQAKVQYTWSPVGTDTLVLRDRDVGGTGLTERLWVQQDVHGNITALISGSGQVVERYLYSPYGAVLVRGADWSPLAGSAYDWRYLFQGGRYEWATGLYNFRARDFSPSLGVWLRPDPLGFGGGDTNLYRYVGGNPATYGDPSGLRRGGIPYLSVGITLVFMALDLDDFRNNRIGWKEFSIRMGLNILALIIDIGTRGNGPGGGFLIPALGRGGRALAMLNENQRAIVALGSQLVGRLIPGLKDRLDRVCRLLLANDQGAARGNQQAGGNEERPAAPQGPAPDAPRAYPFEQQGISYSSEITQGANGETIIEHILTQDGRQQSIGLSTISRDGVLTNSFEVPRLLQQLGISERAYAEAARVGFTSLETSFNAGPTSVNFNMFRGVYDPARNNAVEALLQTPAGRVVSRNYGLRPDPNTIRITETNVSATWIGE